MYNYVLNVVKYSKPVLIPSKRFLVKLLTYIHEFCIASKMFFAINKNITDYNTISSFQKT